MVGCRYRHLITLYNIHRGLWTFEYSYSESTLRPSTRSSTHPLHSRLFAKASYERATHKQTMAWRNVFTVYTYTTSNCVFEVRKMFIRTEQHIYLANLATVYVHNNNIPRRYVVSSRGVLIWTAIYWLFVGVSQARPLITTCERRAGSRVIRHSIYLPALFRK